MTLPLGDDGWHVLPAGDVQLDARRNPVAVGAGEPRGPYAGHASLLLATRAAVGQSARYVVTLDLEAWPVAAGDELTAPDGTPYVVATAERRPGAGGSELGHVRVEADLVAAGRRTWA